MWSITQISPTVHKLYMNLQRVKGSESRILVTSDRHVDSVYSNLELQKEHLDIAKEGGWPVIDLGDICDAMQGRRDPRSSRLAMHEILNQKEEYFDSVVDYASDFLFPWKDCFALMVTGNHETAVLKHNETNLVKRIARRLNEKICVCGYTGWLIIILKLSEHESKRIIVRYTHGNGGAAPVTKGVIQSNRRAVAYPDANIHLAGHTHDAYIVPIPQERINQSGKVLKVLQWHVQVPSYKDATTEVSSGFEAEKGFMPTPSGAAWIKFRYDRKERVKYSVELTN